MDTREAQATNTERGRNRGADPRMVVTAEEMRDDPGVGVVERPIERRPVRSPRRGGGAGAGLMAALAIAAAIIIGLILWALFDDDDTEGTVARGATIDKIAEDPEAYLGQTVTVGGEVNQILGPQAFVIEGNDIIGGDELLVVGANAMNRIRNDEVVQVTGPVRRFDLAQVERDLGVDLDDNLFRDWADKPAIVARNIVATPLAAGSAEAVTIDELTDDPRRYADRLVTTFGSVDRVISPRALVIDNSEFFTEDQVLVVGARPIPNVSARAEENAAINDAPVLVTGTVRPFRIADFVRDLGADLDDNLFRDWDGKPAIVARDINLRPLPADAPGAVGAPIVGINPIFDQPNKAVLVGRDVRLTNVRVQRAVAPNVFWVGPSQDRMMLVVLGADMAGSLPTVREGDMVTLNGLVLYTPSAQRAQQLWALGSATIDRLDEQPIYIQADRIRVAGQ